eukprot:Clim_evm12s33 gene=Clim_evmTU12s33
MVEHKYADWESWLPQGEHAEHGDEETISEEDSSHRDLSDQSLPGRSRSFHRGRSHSETTPSPTFFRKTWQQFSSFFTGGLRHNREGLLSATSVQSASGYGTESSRTVVGRIPGGNKVPQCMSETEAQNAPLRPKHKHTNGQGTYKPLLGPISYSTGGVGSSSDSQSTHLRPQHYNNHQHRGNHYYHGQDPYYLKEIGIATCVIELLALTIGGGLLTLPFGFAHAGAIVSTVLVVLVAFTTGQGLHFLMTCRNLCHEDVNYDGIARAAFGAKAEYAIGIMLITLSQLVMVAYFVLVADSVVGIAANVTDSARKLWHVRIITIVICSAIVMPLASMNTQRQIWWVNRALLFTLFATAVVIVIYSAMCHPVCIDEAHPTIPYQHHNWADRRSPSGWFLWSLFDIDDHKAHPSPAAASSGFTWSILWPGTPLAFSLITLSFLSHFHALPVVRRLSNPTPNRTTKTIVYSGASASLFYVAFAMAAYRQFRWEVYDNILNNYRRNDVVINISRVSLALLFLLSMPHNVAFSRKVMLRVFLPSNLLNNGDKKPPRAVAWTINGLLVAVCAILAIWLSHVGIIWVFLGSTLAIWAMYVLPPIFYLKLRPKRTFFLDVKGLIALCMLIGGIMASLLCIAALVDVTLSENGWEPGRTPLA